MSTPGQTPRPESAEPAPGVEGLDGSGGPLAGLQVVELSSFVATPLAGLTLAQLGAEVIRVEPLGGGPDRGRWPLAPSGTSLYWSGLNRGKQALEIDLADAAGRRLVADLVVEGDGILVTNTERWPELTYEALRARREDIVHVTLTGRHDGSTAVDYTVQAGTGFPLITGPASGAAPVNHVLPAFDVAAGLYLSTGLLAAERHRARTGKGSQVRVALEDVALAIAGNLGYLAEAQLGGRRSREGNDVHGTFGTDLITSDGIRFMFVALTPRQWSDLLAVTGLTQVVAGLEQALGADFTDEGQRYRHRSALFGLLEAWVSTRTWDVVSEALASTRVLWSPYRTFADLASNDSAELRNNPLFSTVDQPGVGAYLAPGSPIRLAAAPDSATRQARAPMVGEHSTDVLAHHLGLGPDRIAELVRDGVVRATPRTNTPEHPTDGTPTPSHHEEN
ncbi:CoA transferase [Nocardioides gilvus]|uniref:CoA transferase n=1 Tax=Nocardioides gilvus TaxID=1735589 RepID=UPI000D743E74|nr:CoA transferase [Nocardioides gilvus]